MTIALHRHAASRRLTHTDGVRPSATRRRARCATVVLALCIVRSASHATTNDILCAGDCNYDGMASVAELVQGVNIALGRAAVTTCVDFDLDGDGTVTINELLGGVGSALHGCPAARFVEAAVCPFTLPPDQDPAQVRCGEVTVREDRAHPDARTVHLPVAVFKAPDPKFDGAQVYLNGGPGESTLAISQFLTLSSRTAAVPERDAVFYDQRGTGPFAQPSLACPEYDHAFFTALTAPGSAADDAATLVAALHDCHDRLVGEGVHLNAYTSAASALDLSDLMTALGYTQWDVFANSYGTRLALTAMRDRPQGLRSVVLDSTVPVQQNPRFASAFDRALDVLFAGCAADAKCNTHYPDLETKLFAVVDRLNAAPIPANLTDFDGNPIAALVTGDRLLLALQQALYQTDLIPFLPFLIDAAYEGNYGVLKQTIAQAGLVPQIAYGMYYSVECGEEYPFLTPEIIAADTADVRPAVKRVALTFVTNRDLAVCGFWGSDTPPAVENEPVSSAIPTLILAGEYDPITPPDDGRLAAQTLSSSQFFELPAVGHGVLFPTNDPQYFNCAIDLAAQFYNAPTAPVDGSCVNNLTALHFFGT